MQYKSYDIDSGNFTNHAFQTLIKVICIKLMDALFSIQAKSSLKNVEIIFEDVSIKLFYVNKWNDIKIIGLDI